tara:strand:- start:673 stop:1335 length:663 start_codon:yes stop_codon:yes gene_type:complete
MRIESKLSHYSEKKVIVRVKGWIEDKSIGSALGEGPTVQLAEDLAISRLNQRLISPQRLDNKTINKNVNDHENTLKHSKLTINKKEVNEESNKEPSDWSKELTEIDSEIIRLNWSREDEISFLYKNLKYKNRSKITKYSEIKKYLNILKNIKINNSKQAVELNIEGLIKESDIILKELSWNHQKGREYLQKEFNVSSRKELDQKQLLSFVNKLNTIRNQT